MAELLESSEKIYTLKLTEKEAMELRSLVGCANMVSLYQVKEALDSVPRQFKCYCNYIRR